MSDTRQAIINSAAILFQRQGYCATGLNQIIQESGSPKGSLYYYFPDGKEELAEAAIHESGKQLAHSLKRAINESKTVSEGITRFLRLFASDFEQSNFEQGCPIATVTLETASFSEPLQKVSKETFHSWCLIIIDALVQEGWTELEARETAIFTMSAFNGALTMCRAAQAIEPLLIVAEQLERFLDKQLPE